MFESQEHPFIVLGQKLPDTRFPSIADAIKIQWSIFREFFSSSGKAFEALSAIRSELSLVRNSELKDGAAAIIPGISWIDAESFDRHEFKMAECVFIVSPKGLHIGKRFLNEGVFILEQGRLSSMTWLSILRAQKAFLGSSDFMNQFYLGVEILFNELAQVTGVQRDEIVQQLHYARMLSNPDGNAWA